MFAEAVESGQVKSSANANAFAQAFGKRCAHLDGLNAVEMPGDFGGRSGDQFLSTYFLFLPIFSLAPTSRGVGKMLSSAPKVDAYFAANGRRARAGTAEGKGKSWHKQTRDEDTWKELQIARESFNEPFRSHGAVR